MNKERAATQTKLHIWFSDKTIKREWREQNEQVLLYSFIHKEKKNMTTIFRLISDSPTRSPLLTIVPRTTP